MMLVMMVRNNNVHVCIWSEKEITNWNVLFHLLCGVT